MGEPFDWTSVDWDDIYPRLWLFARNMIEKAGGRVRKAPEDFAEDAIRKTVEGVRDWSPRQAPLLDHLCEVVSTDVRNAMVLADALEGEIPFSSQQAEGTEENVRRKPIEEDFVGFLEEKHPQLVRLAREILREPTCSVQKLSRKLQVRIGDIEDMWSVLRAAACDFAGQGGGGRRVIIGK